MCIRDSYNNGAFPFKDAHFGESYGPDGSPQMVLTNPPPSADETRQKGILTSLIPLPRWEITQPGNILRVFERGGELKGLPSDIGSPNAAEVPGKPDVKSVSYTHLRAHETPEHLVCR